MADAKTEQKLIVALEGLLGDLYTTYFRAHSCHWNVEGIEFQHLHAYFGDYYTAVHDSIDQFAEAMRMHKVYAPDTLEEVVKLASIKAGKDHDCKEMLKDLRRLNTSLMESIGMVKRGAELVGDAGLANYCDDRSGWHLKQDWQLRAMVK